MTQLYHTSTTDPAPLPFRVRLSDGRTRTDPATFTEAEIADAGYIAAPEQPAHDPETQRVTWDMAAQVWAIEDLPAPPAPEPVPLARLQFIKLGQTAGGMTDAQLVAAKDDTRLAAMWIKLEMATFVDRDNPDTQAAISALAALGYLPNGAAAVLAAWPVG